MIHAPMIHAAIAAAPGTVLFRTWREAAALWTRLVEGVPSHALVLVPDHLHAQLLQDGAWTPLVRALRSFALWRNAHRGERGPVFAYGARPTPIRGRAHIERTRRYILLNPCREGLVADPLAWPFSTHRDAVGLAVPPVCRAVSDPARFHRYVSGDPSTDVAGTPFPAGQASTVADLAAVVAAVSAVTRSTVTMLREFGPARDLLLRAARVLTTATSAQIAAVAGVDPSTVRRASRAADDGVRVVARVLGDARFARLDDGDLRRLPAWRAYRTLR